MPMKIEMPKGRKRYCGVIGRPTRFNKTDLLRLERSPRRSGWFSRLRRVDYQIKTSAFLAFVWEKKYGINHITRSVRFDTHLPFSNRLEDRHVRPAENEL